MDAYLLGAGFSKAVHDPMPLMRELLDRLAGRLGVPKSDFTPFRDDVEMWLSHLSDRQPWETEEAGLANRALFLKASQAIHEVVELASPRVWEDLSETARDLLIRLARQWKKERSAVLTFNYDQIVELALSHEIPCVVRDLYALPLLSRVSFSSFLGGSRQVGQGLPTVYKLHGSTNWLYSGTSDPHAPVVLKEATEDKHLYDDLQPVVVPPTSSKSAFYNNNALRAQWRNAYNHLREADRLVIIGYSMPTTDLQIRSLVGLGLKKSALIIVVDQSPCAAEHVRHLFPEREVDGQFHGPSAIKRFVEATCGHIARWTYVSGQPPRQRLIINGQASERGWEPNPDGVEPEQAAVNELARHWPSVAHSWRPEDQGTVRLHVSDSDYRNCPDPWHGQC